LDLPAVRWDKTLLDGSTGAKLDSGKAADFAPAAHEFGGSPFHLTPATLHVSLTTTERVRRGDPFGGLIHEYQAAA
jgi:hypothetical protein